MVQRLGGSGIQRFRPRGGQRLNPFRVLDCRILYTVGKLAPNSPHFTRELIKYVPGRGYFRAVPSQNGDKFATSPTPPIVERLIFDLPPGQMRYIRGKLADHVGDHVVLFPEGSVLVTSPGTKSSYPRPPQSLNTSPAQVFGCPRVRILP